LCNKNDDNKTSRSLIPKSVTRLLRINVTMDLTWIQHRYMSKWTYLFIKKTGRIKKFCKLSELRFTNIKKQENQINKKKVHKHTCKCEGEGRGRMDASVGETYLWCASEGLKHSYCIIISTQWHQSILVQRKFKKHENILTRETLLWLSLIIKLHCINTTHT
jgi:hypothetical protein